MNQTLQERILNHLNPPQKEAVLHQRGGLLVVAGAGSGKTRVITARIAHLLVQHNVPAESIIALTFTNKAAREMKERIIHFVQNEAKVPFVGTFHAYCLLLLRRYKQLTEFETFSILDAEDQEQMLKKIIKQHGCEKQMTASALQSYISQQKNGAEATIFLPPLFKQLHSAYEEEKQRSCTFDFDDLMVKVLQGFKKHPDFKTAFQERVRHILIDEYQDTNKIQHELLQQMACNLDKTLAIDSICAVGDEDQSIYSWRGAAVSNMQDFKKDFAPVEVIKIEQNYRSVQPILHAANELIAHNTNRISKELWSSKVASHRLLILKCQSGYQEADVIARYIATLDPSIKKSDIAILYRTHYQSRNIEEALIKNSIPYHIVGGLRFYERKEIKDILAYLRLIVNPYDKISFLRIFNVPTRGLGAKFESMIIERWDQEPFFTFIQVLESFLSGPDPLTGVRAQSVTDFIKLFDGLTPEHEPSYLTTLLLQDIGYSDYLRQQYDSDEATTKLENCKELVNSMLHAEKKAMNSSSEPLTVATFLHDIALLQEKIDADEQKEQSINVMTLHAVKGLEFNTVFIIGLEEGILPSSRSFTTAAAIEEERRLLYVGMTRAQERLIISHAEQRMSYGQLNSQEASRFLQEIPSSHALTLDVTKDPLFICEQHLHFWRTGQIQKIAQKIHTSGIRLFGAQKEHPDTKKTIPHPIKPSEPREKWNKNQVVNHKTFGHGIIKMVEKKDAELYLLTISFKQGEKKILSNFVQKI